MLNRLRIIFKNKYPMYFNPALEIYIFDDESVINSTTGMIEHKKNKPSLIIAKIYGYLCCNLKISCERSVQDRDDNYTNDMLERTKNDHNRFRFGNLNGVSADKIYNELFDCKHKIVYQFGNSIILYKRTKSVLQFYMSIEQFSRWFILATIAAIAYFIYLMQLKCILEKYYQHILSLILAIIILMEAEKTTVYMI